MYDTKTSIFKTVLLDLSSLVLNYSESGLQYSSIPVNSYGLSNLT